MAIDTLSEFSAALCALAVGQAATLPLSVYALLFPPREPDSGARARAFHFARAHGCEISNPTSAGSVLEVVFIIREVSSIDGSSL